MFFAISIAISSYPARAIKVARSDGVVSRDDIVYTFACVISTYALTVTNLGKSPKHNSTRKR